MSEREKLADAIREIDHLIENWRVETIAAALIRSGWRHLPLDGPEFDAAVERALREWCGDRLAEKMLRMYPSDVKLMRRALRAAIAALSERLLEDAHLNALADERAGGPFVSVRLGDLDAPLSPETPPMADMTREEREALVADLERGVPACGMHDDGDTELFRIEDANDTMAEAAAALRQTLARIAEVEEALTNLRWEIDAPEVVAGDEFTYFAPRIRDAIAAADAVLAALSPTTGAASEGERT